MKIITFSEEEMIQEQFLSQTVGCDLISNEETEFYTPGEFFALLNLGSLCGFDR